MMNTPGVTGKKEPSPTPDFMHTISFIKNTSITPIKLTKFWELFVNYKGHVEQFPESLADAISSETQSIRDTGLTVDSRMSWAGDRHLTNILAKWIYTERFSSASNCNFKFKQSFTARRRDREFGLNYDSLSHRDIQDKDIGPKSFASSTGYCNPEYTDEMMVDCIHKCMNALNEGAREQKPVRNIVFIPFQKGQLIQ